MAERFGYLNFSAISADEAKVVAATGQAHKPERFGRYLLLDRIGSGGMAEVFKAVMPGAQGFRQTFVVKRILAERSRATDFVDMFVQEARINSLLTHPNIVQVFDFGNVGGDYFLAMEYLRGRDVQVLMRRLREQNLLCPVPVAAFIAHEVATCLGYAHDLVGPDGKRLDIVHRDISPSNIMCLRTGGVKLLDFGIAKAAGDNTENTEQGLFKGKLAYVAPERIKNEALDGRVDLFGLGVVLWEMLVGRRLFRGKSELETLTKVMEMPVPRPSAERPDVPASLDAIVLRALDRDRTKRYATGHEMADDLEKVLRETAFHSRMLPDLLREAFGSDLSRSQESLSLVTPEMLASIAEETGTGSDTSVPKAEVERRQQGVRWKRVMAVFAASAATVVLVALAVGRGGGGRSQAHERPPAPPVTAPAPKIAPLAPVTPGPALAPAAEQAPAPEQEAAPAAPATAAEEADRGDDSDGKHKRRHRHRDRAARKQAAQEADRVVRGLSVDPFAEAARGSKP
jgi:serine/threonine protein kinase